MIQCLELKEETFTELDPLMEYLEQDELNTTRRMVRLGDLELLENGVKVQGDIFKIEKNAFIQLCKISNMNWGNKYFTEAPTDLIISDFKRMVNIYQDMNCRLVIKDGEIIRAVLPQDLIVAPYPQVVDHLQFSDIELATVSNDGIRLSNTSGFELEVDRQVNDIVRTGVDFTYSNTNWSKQATISPFVLRLVCTNGLTSRNNSIFKQVRYAIPKNGDLQYFYNKLSQGENNISIKSDLLITSFNKMKETCLKDVNDYSKFVNLVKYWLGKDLFESSTKLNKVIDDKIIIVNEDCNNYTFFNEITDMAKQLPMVRRRKVEELAGEFANRCLYIKAEPKIRQL